ncbi:MAG: thermonuclease family protein [Planctomycetota bacterium]
MKRIARRHRRLRLMKLCVVALLVGGLVLSFWLGRGGTVYDDVARFDGHWFPVDRVVDGDTLRVLDGGESVSVRLLGIDTPEPGAPGGDQATDAVKRVLGDRVLLDVHGPRTRDKYGRLLAYVYLSESEMLNRLLINEGLAYAYRPKAHAFSRDFGTAEARARKKQLGLWATITDEQQPVWRQKWLSKEEERRKAALMPWQR